MNDMTTFAGHLSTAKPQACPTCGQHWGHGPLSVDISLGTISSGQRTIRAPRREVLIAAALNDAFPKGLTHDALMRAAYHPDEWEKASDNTLFSHTCKLRKRLREAGFPIAIVHPRGLGVAMQVVE